jgi:hypothetical protein
MGRITPTSDDVIGSGAGTAAGVDPLVSPMATHQKDDPAGTLDDLVVHAAHASARSSQMEFPYRDTVRAPELGAGGP